MSHQQVVPVEHYRAHKDRNSEERHHKAVEDRQELSEESLNPCGIPGHRGAFISGM